MREGEFDVIAGLAEVERLGLRVIAGGSDADGVTGDTEAGTDAGDGVSGDEGDGGGDPGAEGARGQAQDGQSGVEGDRMGADGDGRSRYVPYDRFHEVNTRAQELERTNRLLLERFTGQQGQQGEPRRGFEVPKELQEIDGHLNPYMRHYLSPFASAMAEHKQHLADVRDEARFYRQNPQYATERHAQVIEETMEALKPRIPDITRADVLRYLRGHEKYGKDFTSPEQQTRQQQDRIAGAQVAARRSAGATAGRTPAGRANSGAPLDPSSMSREERIKHFEREAGGQAF